MIMRKYKIKTNKKQGLFRIDAAINELIEEKRCNCGLCLIFLQHTTAALCITNKKDVASALDVSIELDRLVPTRIDFLHHMDTPRDAAGHIKTAIVGVSLCCPIRNNKMDLGQAQGVFFCEFDGPRNRSFNVLILEEEIIQLDEKELNY